MKGLLTICAALTSTSLGSHRLQPVENEVTEYDARDPRQFLLFLGIKPSVCPTNSDAQPFGRCSSSSQCSNRGGTPSGSCGGVGVCCYYRNLTKANCTENHVCTSCDIVVLCLDKWSSQRGSEFSKTCGQTIRSNSTRFVNPSFPDNDTTVSNCEITVRLLNRNICQLRLNFDTFELEQPNVNGQCETDFMSISGSATDASVPRLCGSNTGRHLYVDLDRTGGNPKINIDTGLTSFGRSWNITVDQIACSSIYKAPAGCSQYYTESSGIVESFNYATPTADTVADGTSNLHLSSQNYGICVAARTGYCSITWAPNTVDQNATYTFLMSQDTSGLSEDILGTSAASLMGSSSCPTDYVLIPKGSYTDDTGAVGDDDRYCGLAFPTEVVSSVQPFVMYVMTDSTDDPTDTDSPDTGNAGFSLQYRQNACNNNA